MHANGWGAYGVLKITGDLSKYTKAKVLQPGAETEMIARFSTVAGEVGAADAERDVRGFALKFYTEDGNWDLVGNNTPVFFVRDSYKFPDFIHTQKRHPKTNLRSPTAMWDFWSLSPESLHQVTILMSDRGIPKSPMHMNGYGSHTYSLWNDEGERYWVKFHFKTMQGHEFYTNAEAEQVIGKSRETFQEALYGAIEKGDFPKWKFQVQIMKEKDAENQPYNPFDLTKVWPHKDFPCIDVGILELNRNPENYFNEIEQLAFAPSNIVPGISWSPDKMLQTRVFSYADAHRYRLGTHYESLPVNAPNSMGGVEADPSSKEPPLKISGDADRYDSGEGNDNFSQPRALFELFDEGQRNRLFQNIAEAMKGVPEQIIERQIDLFEKVHPEYGAGVRKAIEKLPK